MLSEPVPGNIPTYVNTVLYKRIYVAQDTTHEILEQSIETTVSGDNPALNYLGNDVLGFTYFPK